MPSIAEGNRGMSDAWDGDEGAYWAANADRYERGGTPYRAPLLEAAALAPGERVLDIGCGAGRLSLDSARAVGPGGQVVGLDLSAAMLSVARERARNDGLDNVDFVQADAQVYDVDGDGASFDAAVSQFGVMFFADPVAAFANIGRAVRPGGRLLVMVWQDLAHNDWASTMRTVLGAGRQLPEPPPGAPGPFSWADPATAERVLGDSGWGDLTVDAVPGDFNVGPDVDEAFAFIRGMGITTSLLADLDEPTKERTLGELRAVLAEHVTTNGVVFASSAWLVGARRP
jgi:SAM-dependent methyltransferase